MAGGLSGLSGLSGLGIVGTVTAVVGPPVPLFSVVYLDSDRGVIVSVTWSRPVTTTDNIGGSVSRSDYQYSFGISGAQFGDGSGDGSGTDTIIFAVGGTPVPGDSLILTMAANSVVGASGPGSGIGNVEAGGIEAQNGITRPQISSVTIEADGQTATVAFSDLGGGSQNVNYAGDNGEQNNYFLGAVSFNGASAQSLNQNVFGSINPTIQAGEGFPITIPAGFALNSQTGLASNQYDGYAINNSGFVYPPQNLSYSGGGSGSEYSLSFDNYQNKNAEIWNGDQGESGFNPGVLIGSTSGNYYSLGSLNGGTYFFGVRFANSQFTYVQIVIEQTEDPGEGGGDNPEAPTNPVPLVTTGSPNGSGANLTVIWDQNVALQNAGGFHVEGPDGNAYGVSGDQGGENETDIFLSDNPGALPWTLTIDANTVTGQTGGLPNDGSGTYTVTDGS